MKRSRWNENDLRVEADQLQKEGRLLFQVEDLLAEKYGVMPEQINKIFLRLGLRRNRLRPATRQPSRASALRRAQPAVYVVRPTDGQLALMKIGYSADVPHRFEDLQRSSPVSLRLVGVLYHPRALRLEQDLHDALHEDRSHGEWYRDTERVRRCLVCAGFKLA